MDDFYAARSRTIPPLPWSNIAPPFSLLPGVQPAPACLRTIYKTDPWKGRRPLGRWVASRLAHGDAVAVSMAAARADYALGARQRRERADIIRYGVEPNRIVRLRGPRSPFRLLFAGVLESQSGADLLPAILGEAHRCSKRHDVEVTICGRGPLRGRLAEQLSGRLAGWRIAFADPIACLADELANYDAVLMPSRSEGMSLLPLQALLSRVPLIAARAPGLEEVVTNDYALTAAVNDIEGLAGHLTRVLIEDAPFISAALRARLARNFDMKTMVGAYEARYRALASRTDAVLA